MSILGIDPGLSGGLAILDNTGRLSVETMPVIEDHLDLQELVRLLSTWKELLECAYIEKVASMPGQGISSTFKFGEGYGAIQGVLAALSIPFEQVTPGRWMKVLHAGIPEITKTVREGKQDDGTYRLVKEVKDTKAMSRLAASRLFPGIDFRATEKSKVAHEGIVEAALIAEYGRRVRRA